jgi:hypothetical protein
MRVVMMTIKDKIDKAIDENGKDIFRIELTNSEFADFIYSGVSPELYRTSIVFNGAENGYSGSHVMYRDVCVQTHHSYTE